MFEKNNVKFYSFVPQDSTLLQFCVYTHKIDFLVKIFEERV